MSDDLLQNVDCLILLVDGDLVLADESLPEGVIQKEQDA